MLDLIIPQNWTRYKIVIWHSYVLENYKVYFPKCRRNYTLLWIKFINRKTYSIMLDLLIPQNWTRYKIVIWRHSFAWESYKFKFFIFWSGEEITPFFETSATKKPYSTMIDRLFPQNWIKYKIVIYMTFLCAEKIINLKNLFPTCRRSYTLLWI